MGIGISVNHPKSPKIVNKRVTKNIVHAKYRKDTWKCCISYRWIYLFFGDGFRGQLKIDNCKDFFDRGFNGDFEDYDFLYGDLDRLLLRAEDYLWEDV